jgi:pyruvate ferredoxin oxidoreductase beta subunit/2-oxoisovalerate ferredoxin oxidoreductase beta subunit
MLGRILSEREEDAMLSIPACCGAVAAGAFPTTSYGAPAVNATFAASAAFGSGLAAVGDMNEEPGQVICWAGDGGTYDIGMATLSATRSSATPPGAKTSTTPYGKGEEKKDIMSIMTAHGIPYAATLSLAHPDDFARKLHTALSMQGTRFLLIHSPCPTGWKSEPADSVELVRIAVASGLFPLYEVWEGKYYRINEHPDWTDPAEYYERQRRFNTQQVDLDATRRSCRERFQRLGVLAREFPYTGPD